MSRSEVGTQLLVEREDPYFKLSITDKGLKKGAIYTENFSTTSPPAYVLNTFRITKIDKYGAWGKLLHSSVREMEIWQV